MSITQLSSPLLRFLFIEDLEDDALLVVDFLRSGGLQFDWQRVATEQEVSLKLQESWDIVFSDYTMPGFSGIRALEIVRKHDPDLPFIFISGTIGEEIAVEALKQGAQDYVMKGNMGRLLPAIDRELREAQSRRERRQTDQLLRKLSLVVTQTTDSVFVTDREGHIEYVNPAFELLTGYSIDEAKGKTPAILCSGQHDRNVYCQLWDTIVSGNIYKGTLVNRRKNGEFFHQEQEITPLKDERGHITHYVATGRDISNRVNIERERARLAAILEATPDLVAIFEPSGVFRYLNGAGRLLLGISMKEDITQHRMQTLFREDIAQQMMDEIIKSASQDGIWSGETVLQIAAGRELPVSQVVLAHKNNSHEIHFLSTIARDISERKRFEAELQYQATHDRLTNLPNRFFLLDRFATALEHARRHRHHVAVLFLDMDHFKRINDTLGHAAGDSLLQQVAQRLQSCMRANDTVARHGGDEFTIVVGDLDDPENILGVLRKLRKAIELPVIVNSQEIYVTFSTGIALYPHDGTGIDDLLSHADIAMYQAKSAGPNQYRFYAPNMNVRGHELLALEADLRRAMEQEEFVLHYQPQIDLRDNRIIGAEGLIRWQHPTRGLVSPADFIPLLEKSGMIVPVGEWVMHEACRMHRKWRKLGFNDLRVSINVSAAQFGDVDLLAKVQRVLKEEHMPHQALEFEITENILMRDPVSAAELLEAIHALGVRIAIDDFGTGYSSLAYLKRFPLDALKIDQTFVRDITSDTSDAAIVEASVSLAHKLDLEVVAEGVETEQQLAFLCAQGCDLVQGYYFGRPVTIAEFTRLLQQ
ncbi:EAL domain-containing protein [Nitrosomonas sp.]|uniref:EAL domain-containing protein n=1 Tax=Nitrosomonas sp. TaxID=42353 RepID=UPI0026356DB2|nr:EAL domain-containing protein [Nitrosomonas sp.]